jgi:hypothetical protein
MDYLYTADARQPAPEFAAALAILSDPRERAPRPVTCPKFAAMLAAHHAACAERDS